MTQDSKKVKELLDSSSKVLVVVNNQASFDTYAAAIAFFLYLRDRKKNVSLCMNGEPVLKHKKLLEKYEIKYLSQIKPLSYVISLDHAGGAIDKVGWDDKEGKFNIYITPSVGSKGFDFDDVSYSYGGSDYDAIVVFGARSLKWLGDLYQGSKAVFERSKTVNINNISGNQEFGDLKMVVTGVSVCEQIYELIKGISLPSMSKIVDLLAKGLTEHLQPLQRSEYKIESLERLAAMVKLGANFKAIFKYLYLDRDLPNFKIVQRLMSNLKIDSNAGLAWSGVSSFDFSQCGVNRENFELDGRIVFDTAQDFRFALAMYEVASDEVWVEAESNDEVLDTHKIFRNYSPKGNPARVTFVLKNKSLVEVESELLDQLKNAMGVTDFVPMSEFADEAVKPEVTPEEESNTSEGLTTKPKSSDNGQSKEAGQVTPPPVDSKEM